MLLVTDFLTAWAEVVIKVKQIVFVSRWCYKSGPLNRIGQLSRDGICCNTRIKFADSHWSVSANFDPSPLILGKKKRKKSQKEEKSAGQAQQNRAPRLAQQGLDPPLKTLTFFDETP